MSPLRVLYVEDNDDVRELIGELLLDEGLDVTPCETAEQALARFTVGGFDFVLTDVSLPGVSGTELAKRLLALEPALWLVFASATRCRSRKPPGGRACAPCSSHSMPSSSAICSLKSGPTAKPEAPARLQNGMSSSMSLKPEAGLVAAGRPAGAPPLRAAGAERS